MINAISARDNTLSGLENKLKSDLERVEFIINSATKLGRFQVSIRFEIESVCNAMEHYLTELGYKVNKTNNMDKVLDINWFNATSMADVFKALSSK